MKAYRLLLEAATTQEAQLVAFAAFDAAWSEIENQYPNSGPEREDARHRLARRCCLFSTIKLAMLEKWHGRNLEVDAVAEIPKSHRRKGDCVYPPPRSHARSPFHDRGLCMFSSSSYDPETLGVLSRVFDEAWKDIRAMVGPMPLDPDGLRSALAMRILAAAESGERDKRLKA
jgi:hypothetical protein